MTNQIYTVYIKNRLLHFILKYSKGKLKKFVCVFHRGYLSLHKTYLKWTQNELYGPGSVNLFKSVFISLHFRRIKLPELQALLYQQDGETVFGIEYDIALHPGEN